MKPNYMVIGAAKCATTTICSLLGRHPEVFLVACKEPQFFNNSEVYARGFDWYESLYADAGDRPLRGEGSNAYTMRECFPLCFSRLRSYAPQLKLIYVVREPYSRIMSWWTELRTQNLDYIHHDFNEAVRVNREWLIDTTNYHAQLEPYRRHYGDESIHVVFMDDFQRDAAGVMRGIFAFLGVDPAADVGAMGAHLNKSDNKRLPPPFLSILPMLPGYYRVPRILRDKIARAVSYRKARQKPQWTPESRRFATVALRDDLRAFLETYGKPRDLWKFDNPPLDERVQSLEDQGATSASHIRDGEALAHSTARGN